MLETVCVNAHLTVNNMVAQCCQWPQYSKNNVAGNLYVPNAWQAHVSTVRTAHIIVFFLDDHEQAAS